MNNYKIVVLLFSLSIFGWGCVTGGTKQSLKKKDLKESEPTYSAKVMRPSLLKKQESSLIVVPFTAGVGVEADRDLDRLSLMIVKGIIDTLQQHSTPFKILTAQEADKADLVVQGHITDRENPGVHKNWMFHPKGVTLSVEARMTERQTGNLVLIYSRQRKAKLTKGKKDEEMNLAQQIGQDMAEYILGQVK